MTTPNEALQPKTCYVPSEINEATHYTEQYEPAMSADGDISGEPVIQLPNCYVFTKSELAELMKEEIRKAWQEGLKNMAARLANAAGKGENVEVITQETYLTGRLKELGL